MKTSITLLFTLALSALSACTVSDQYTDYETKEVFLQRFCGRVASCGNAPGGQDCVDYNLSNVCPDDECQGPGDMDALDECLDDFEELGCAAPLEVPMSCKDIMR